MATMNSSSPPIQYPSGARCSAGPQICSTMAAARIDQPPISGISPLWILRKLGLSTQPVRRATGLRASDRNSDSSAPTTKIIQGKEATKAARSRSDIEWHRKVEPESERGCARDAEWESVNPGP